MDINSPMFTPTVQQMNALIAGLPIQFVNNGDYQTVNALLANYPAYVPKDG